MPLPKFIPHQVTRKLGRPSAFHALVLPEGDEFHFGARDNPCARNYNCVTG